MRKFVDRFSESSVSLLVFWYAYGVYYGVPTLTGAPHFWIMWVFGIGAVVKFLWAIVGLLTPASTD